MRKSLAAAVCLLLAGCSDFAGPGGFGITGVAPGSNSEVAAYSDALTPGSPAGPLTPNDYILTSLAMTDERCEAFFQKLKQLREDSSLINQVLNAAVAVASPLGAAKSVTAINAVAALNNQVPEIYAFAQHADGIHRQVKELMSSYRSTHYLNDLVRYNFGVAAPASAGANAQRLNAALLSKPGDPLYRGQMAIARSVAVNYASLCTIPTIDDIVAGALNNTVSVSLPGGRGVLGGVGGSVTEPAPGR